MDIKQLEEQRKSLLRRINIDLQRLNDPLLSEEVIRETNDRVNALLRKRRFCDASIRRLGGPSYPQPVNGTSLKGRLYFGRAKELPDVQVLLKEAALQKQEKDRGNNLAKFYAVKLPKLYPVGRKMTYTPGDKGLTKLNFNDSPDVQAFIIKKKKELLLRKLKA